MLQTYMAYIYVILRMHFCLESVSNSVANVPLCILHIDTCKLHGVTEDFEIVKSGHQSMHTERDIVMANLSVSPSVRHTLVLYANIIKLFPPSRRGMTTVFLALPLLQNSQGNSLIGDVKHTRWCEKISIFDRNLRLSRKRYEIGGLRLQ